MFPSNWIRWSGLVGMVCGALWALWYVGAYFVGWAPTSKPEYETYNRLMTIVLLLLLVGLAGAHTLQRSINGWLGTIGFVLASLGLVVMIAGNVTEFWAFTEEAYGSDSLRNFGWMGFGLGQLTPYIGSVLFGVATLRARMLPRLGALLLLVWFPAGMMMSGLLQLASVPEALAFSGLTGLCGLGWIILGYALWSGGSELVGWLQHEMRASRE